MNGGTGKTVTWMWINPLQPGVMFAATDAPGQPGQPYRTLNGGLSWETSGAGLYIGAVGELAPRIVFRVEADHHRLGVAYAATDDGVFRFYGGGLPSCLDTRAGIDNLQLWPDACPPVLSPGPVIPGDAIAFDLAALVKTSTHVDLGEVECLADGGDIALATVDPPEPAPGHALGLLLRLAGSTDYGFSSDGLPRQASFGDCP